MAIAMATLITALKIIIVLVVVVFVAAVVAVMVVILQSPQNRCNHNAGTPRGFSGLLKFKPVVQH